MTEARSDKSKADGAAVRAAKKAAEEAEEERSAKELRTLRTQQLESSQAAVEQLEGELRAVRKTAKRCEILSNHSEGFYDEINKLAKGKTLVETTPLFVDQTNDIIRDAKDIVKNEVYLDRTKEFVPAGNNPVYPEVVTTKNSVGRQLNDVTRTPCPLRPGSNVESAGSPAQELDFAWQTSIRLVLHSPARLWKPASIRQLCACRGDAGRLEESPRPDPLLAVESVD
jgi:hypothetical protein